MKRISEDLLPVFFTGAMLVIGNSWHVIMAWAKNSPGHVFTGIAHYFADYFLYVSLIAQGGRGAFLFTDHLFTNESLSPTWIYWVYTLIGKFQVFGLSPFALYAISLLLFAVILLFLWWHTSRKIFSNQPVTSFIAFLFLTTASHIPVYGDFWFSPTPALNRLGGVPHQILQSILLLGGILCFTRLLTERQKRVRFYFLLGLLSFWSATSNPIQMLLLVITATITGLLYGAHEKISRKDILLTCFSIAIPALCGALLTNSTFARDPILTAAKIWEDSQHVSVGLLQFLFALGPITLLIPFGIRSALKEKSPLFLFFTLLGILSFGIFFSPIPALLHTSPVRWISPVTYAMFPLLAVLGMKELVAIFSSRLSIKPPIVRDLIVVLYIVATLPSFYSQIQARTIPLTTDPTQQALNHVAQPLMDILHELEMLPGHDVVLTDPTLPYDVLIPLTGKKTFTGHPIHTLYPQTKEELRHAFFEGSMNNADAERFFTDHGIRFVITAKETAPLLSRYPMLHIRDVKDGLTLYER